ncbi:MAG: hypothetical protein HKM24_05700, partial [Gammaproteobacteria bacterium]|nr:hypothetical protein [Gammaproteobacteria bacterium]
MKVDICHVNFSKEFHVAERQTELLIKALAAYNIPQRLVARKNSPLAQQCQGVSNLSVYEGYEPVTAFFACRSSKLVHAHDWVGGFIALLSKWIWRVPYILIRRLASSPKKKNKAMHLLYQNASEIIVLTKGSLEAMNKY